jgi:hypothetical protein
MVERFQKGFQMPDVAEYHKRDVPTRPHQCSSGEKDPFHSYEEEPPGPIIPAAPEDDEWTTLKRSP